MNRQHHRPAGLPGQASAPPSLFRQQAVSLYRAGRHQEALQTCRQALALAPKQADLLALAGLIAMELRQVEEAAGLYEAAVAAKRDFAEAHYNLGIALTELGRTEEAVAAYRRAAKLRPDLLPIHNNLGNALQSLGQWEGAEQAYRRGLALAPDNAELQRNLGTVLQASGKIDEALAACRRAVALKPGWSLAQSTLANLLVETGAPREVVAACDAWLAQCPGTIEAIGLKSVALDELGERAAARYLVDLDRFVRVLHFERPPAGYASMRDFNAALAQHALAHPTLTLPAESDPRYHCPTLRITGEFLAEPKGPAAALEAMMNEAVSDYITGISAQDREHPYLANPPRRWRLTSWAAVLDRQGSLEPHIHYDGYVSGVYYCHMPAEIGASDESEAGWFELGRLPERVGSAAAPEICAIRPREGMMILFPSYFYHRTVPFEAAEPRISIAFDAAPLG